MKLCVIDSRLLENETISVEYNLNENRMPHFYGHIFDVNIKQSAANGVHCNFMIK